MIAVTFGNILTAYSFRLLAARRGRPGEGVYQTNLRQMAVNKPRNIDDADLIDGELGPDFPVTQPTEMSYFLQRILLAEIARGTVDQRHDSVAAKVSDELCRHVHVMAMDAELSRMTHRMPSFLRLDSYERISDPTTGRLFVQAYLLNSILHTQRCKLHLSYLASGPNRSNPAYASSRETCLASARQILRAELQMEKAQHPFALIRVRLTGILYGVFIAGIVLLMDACVNGTGSQQHEDGRGEAADALRIIEKARSHSPAAAILYESLMRVLAEHRAQQQQLQQKRQSYGADGLPPPPPPGSSAPPACASKGSMRQTSLESPQYMPVPFQAAVRGLENSLGVDTLSCISQGQQAVTTIEPPPYNDQLAQNLEELMEFNDFQWDALYSVGVSTSFSLD